MRSEGRGRERGMVTAELAACLPVLVLLLGVAISAVLVVAARVRVQDAAREAARAEARGAHAAVSGLVHRAAPGGAVTISRDGVDVVAVVRLQVRPLGGLVPAVTVTGSAVAAAEPQGGPP